VNAAELLVKALENEGVETIHGVPGEENLDFLEAIRKSGIRLILTRHEQGAAFMAATYGRFTGSAELLSGGSKIGDTLYQPTVLLDPPADCRVSTEEVFGPVICVYSCRDRQDAIRRANSLDVAFQAAVFTNDLNSAFDTIRRLDAAAVMVNDHTAFRVDWMPFGGRRVSGYGIGGIGYTMHDMIQPKMAVIKMACIRDVATYRMISRMKRFPASAL